MKEYSVNHILALNIVCLTSAGFPRLGLQPAGYVPIVMGPSCDDTGESMEVGTLLEAIGSHH